MILPEPVMRNRFEAPLWVLFFGIVAVSPRRVVGACPPARPAVLVPGRSLAPRGGPPLPRLGAHGVSTRGARFVLRRAPSCSVLLYCGGPPLRSAGGSP